MLSAASPALLAATNPHDTALRARRGLPGRACRDFRSGSSRSRACLSRCWARGSNFYDCSAFWQTAFSLRAACEPVQGCGNGERAPAVGSGHPRGQAGPRSCCGDTVGPRLHLRETLRFMRIYSFTVFTNHKHICGPRCRPKLQWVYCFPLSIEKIICKLQDNHQKKAIFLICSLCLQDDPGLLFSPFENE